MTHLRLKPEVKALWLDALRSGEYQQGREALQSKDGFCCLGVLCDVYRSKVDESMGWTDSCSGNMAFGHYGDDNVAYPPEEVYKWAFENYEAQCGVVNLPHTVYATESRGPDEEGEAGSLVGCNDDLKLNFKQIADVIEEQL